jgi:hypothetical protein
MMATIKEIEDEINSLPPGFFGTVEFTFQAGIPTFIRTTRQTKLNPKLPSIGTNGNNYNNK